jgi:hypothetical protein
MAEDTASRLRHPGAAVHPRAVGAPRVEVPRVGAEGGSDSIILLEYPLLHPVIILQIQCVNFVTFF